MARFTDYALWKMNVRGIERDYVELVLADPECDFSSRNSERHIYSRHVGGQLLYVYVEPYDHECVVNVFEPRSRDRIK